MCASKRRPLSYHRQLILFLTPYLVGTLLLVFVPALATVGLAFARYGVIGKPVWGGWANFQQLIGSPLVRLTLRNTVIFLGLAVPVRLGAALVLALLLQGKGRVLGAARAAVYLPTIVPETAYTLIWLWLLNPVTGPLNIILSALGLPAPAWLTEPGTARLAMAIMAFFQIGEAFVVVMAGLQNIPQAIYEAAAVDGASGWQNLFHITLPLLSPLLLLLTVRDLVVSLQNTFVPSFVMTYGGPYYGTTFAPLLVYEFSFDQVNLGLASAFMVLLYILLGVLALAVRNLIGPEGGISDAD